jgi:hypothetical protein
MSRGRLIWIVVAAAAAVPCTSLRAQTSVAIAAGVSGARGDFGNAVNTGYHLLASIATDAGVYLPSGRDRAQRSNAGSPFRIRVDGGLTEFRYKVPGISNAKARVLSGTANALVSPPQFGGGYVIGGIGLYHMSAECDGCTTSTTKGGLNGGVGYELRFTGIRLFAEARYHYIAGPSDPTTAGVKSSTQFVPISLGVIF